MAVVPRAASVAVWDLPVRAVHWLMLVLFGLSWWSGEAEWHLVHRLSGYAMLSVVLFRVYWGFAGSETARFRHFIRPAAVLPYLDSLFTRDAQPSLGHNPLGGLSAVLLLMLLASQCLLGLFALPVDGVDGGPASPWLTFELAREIAQLHMRLFDVILLLVGVHVLAIAFYWLVKRQNLLKPMLTGVKAVPEGAVTRQPDMAGMPKRAATLAVLALAGAVWVLEF